MTEPMITRSVTVQEQIEADGAVYLVTTTEGEPAVWDQIGMLAYALAELQAWAAKQYLVEDDE